MFTICVDKDRIIAVVRIALRALPAPVCGLADELTETNIDDVLAAVLHYSSTQTYNAQRAADYCCCALRGLRHVTRNPQSAGRYAQTSMAGDVLNTIFYSVLATPSSEEKDYERIVGNLSANAYAATKLEIVALYGYEF